MISDKLSMLMSKALKKFKYTKMFNYKALNYSLAVLIMVFRNTKKVIKATFSWASSLIKASTPFNFCLKEKKEH